jgi:membrane associated rhomboid family serine protease
MSRYAPSSSVSYAFGPGPISLAVKWIIIINVAIFVVTTCAPPTLFDYFGLVPARIFVMIYGGLALLNTFQPSRGVADAAHLGGMVFGYLYLQGGRGGFGSEIKYRYLKWKMNRLRRKFDVYSGGRSDWDGKIH